MPESTRPIHRLPDAERGKALSGYRGRQVKIVYDHHRDGSVQREIVGESLGVTWLDTGQWGITLRKEGGGLTAYRGSRIRSIEALPEQPQQRTMPAPAGQHVCVCRRPFDTKWGLRVHMRSCPIERARSDAWVAAAEQGGDPIAAGDAAVREALAARR